MSPGHPEHSHSSVPATVPDPLPPWLDHFTPANAHHFVQLVADVVAARWSPGVAALDPARGIIVLDDGGMIGVANIARQLATVAEPRWRAIVYEFISSMDDLGRGGPLELSDWDLIAPTLGIRLFASSIGLDLFGRPIGENLVLGIGARISIGVAAITTTHVASWNVDFDEIWERAKNNPTNDDDLQVTLCLKDDVPNDHTPADQPAIVMLSGDLFITGRVLDLSFLHGVVRIDEHGALVCAPSSELLLVLPIGSPDQLAVRALELCELAATFHENEPHPLSASVLWYRGPGQLCEAIDIPSRDRAIKTVAPEPLRTWLKRPW